MEDLHISIGTKENFVGIDNGISLNKIGYIDEKEINFRTILKIEQCIEDIELTKIGNELNKTKYTKKKYKNKEYLNKLKIKNKTLKKNIKKEFKFKIKDEKKIYYIIDEAWNFFR